MDGRAQGTAAAVEDGAAALASPCLPLSVLRVAEPAPAGAPRGQRKAVWRPRRRAALGLVVAPVVAAMALPLLLLGREVSAPGWLRERVERQASALLDGGALAVEDVTLRVGADLHPQVRLLGAALRDAEGRVLAQVPDLALTLSPRGLLKGRLLVQAITVTGAEASLRRAPDGRVDVVLGDARAIGGGTAPGAPSDGLASLPDRFESLFERPALEALRRVAVEGLVVNYEDARAGRAWTLDGGRLELELGGGQTRLSGEVSVLSGGDGAATARLDYRSPRGGPEAELALTLTDVPAADVASQAPALAWLGVLDAPVSLALRATLDAEGRLGPLRAALKIAEGQLRPRGGAPPVGFDLARAYLAYDPAERRLDFDRIDVESDWGSVRATGRAWLDGPEDAMPSAVTGQFDLRGLALSPPGLWPDSLRLSGASADLRIGLDPFVVEVVQATASDAGSDAAEGLGRVLASGRVAATGEGWSVAADATLPQATRDRLLELWPPGWREGLRDWFVANLGAGRLTDAAVALRVGPGAPLRLVATARFDGVAVRPLAAYPPIRDAAGRLSWDTGALSVALERGWVDAPAGGAVDLAGTALTVPAGGGDRPPARIELAAGGSVTAGLSLLDLPPLSLLSASGLAPDLAGGEARAEGTADIRLGAMRAEEARYDIAGTLTDVRSDALVPGWTLTADRLAVAATEAGVAIEGPVRLGGIAATGRWSQARDAPGRSQVEAEVTVTPEALAAIGVALPEGAVSGRGSGRLEIGLAARAAPRFAFASDLAGLSLRLPEMGWSKGAGSTGRLEVEGRLGSPPAIDRVTVAAPGLAAERTLRLTAGGALDVLDLDRLEVGGWFDAAVRLIGRGRDATPGVEVAGGRIDLRHAAFGAGGEGEGGPITVRLDQLQVTDAIALTAVSADLSTVSGLEGTFRGLVNGEAEVSGRLAPSGGRVGARIQGEDAGAVLRAADLFARAEGGMLDLLLIPTGEASYDGEAFITGLRVREAPVLASLLNAVSVVGLLQQLGGQGILFEQVAAKFRIDPDRVSLRESSAVGASMGLSMDGAYDVARGAMDFQGVFSPVYFINGIGQLFSRPGEGLIGFNFTLDGSPADPVVGVNPLSALTPGMFRDLFRRSPPP